MNGGRGRTPGAPRIADHDLNKARVRYLASRAAPRYDAAAWLPRQVARALMEHLLPVRMQPKRILDVGAGTGICSRMLSAHFRSARVISVDCASAALRVARSHDPRWFSKHTYACGDAASLPVADASIDLLVSNLMLPSYPPTAAILAEFHRVLRPGGLLTFSSLGPGTLQELRDAWMAVDRQVHVHAFADMHDLGDALLRAGLRDVVMDCERVTGRYRDLSALTTELRQLGVNNAARGRAKTLTTAAQLAAVVAEYEHLRCDGTLPASFEIVFAHGWRAPQHSVDVSADAMLRPSR